MTADLGANLHLWGPEFCGQATVHWSIISFTVKFGKETPQRLKPIKWPTFETAFLPKSEQICTIGVTQGLIRHLPADGKKEPCWIVNAKELVLSVQSVIPFSPIGKLPAYLQLADEIGKLPNKPAIASMGLEAHYFDSELSITMTRNLEQPIDHRAFQLSPILKALPAGLWGEPQFSDEKHQFLELPDVNKPQLIDNMLVGFEIRPTQLTKKPNNTCAISIAELQDQVHPMGRALTWQSLSLSEPDKNDTCGQTAWQAAKATLSTKPVEQAGLFVALGMVNAIVDYGEPIDQAKAKTA